VPGLGGYSPAPHQFGGASGTSLEGLQDTIAASMGGGLTNDPQTLLWAENHASARVWLDLYGLVDRLANQWDPYRITDFLPRWEAILGITPPRGSSLADRRREVLIRQILIGKGTVISALQDFLTLALNGIFDTIEYTDADTPDRYCPGGGAIPGGPTLLDGNALGSDMSPYYTRVGYIVVKVKKPGDISEEEFYRRVSTMYNTVGGLIAGWVGWDWVRESPQGPGFFLDEDLNLDNQAFDE